MGKNKLAQFAENKEFPHVIEPELPEVMAGNFYLKGNWGAEFFKNNNPIVLELGCGKGEYTVGMAKLYPNKNFIGVDIKGNRIWRGAKTVDEEKLKNCAFLRTKVDYIEKFFANNEIDEIWLTFSDPQPKRPRKRLTSPKFISQYRQFLSRAGCVHLKTDSRLLFNYTLEQIQQNNYYCPDYTFDLYRELEKFTTEEQQYLMIKTHYEKLFVGKGFRINYLNFSLNEKK